MSFVALVLCRISARGAVLCSMTRISCRTADWVPVVALAERAGLPELLAERVRPGGGCGVNAPLKVGCLVAGMAAGAGLMCPTAVPS